MSSKFWHRFLVGLRVFLFVAIVSVCWSVIASERLTPADRRELCKKYIGYVADFSEDQETSKAREVQLRSFLQDRELTEELTEQLVKQDSYREIFDNALLAEVIFSSLEGLYGAKGVFSDYAFQFARINSESLQTYLLFDIVGRLLQVLPPNLDPGYAAYIRKLADQSDMKVEDVEQMIIALEELYHADSQLWALRGVIHGVLTNSPRYIAITKNKIHRQKIRKTWLVGYFLVKKNVFPSTISAPAILLDPLTGKRSRDTFSQLDKSLRSVRRHVYRYFIAELRPFLTNDDLGHLMNGGWVVDFQDHSVEHSVRVKLINRFKTVWNERAELKPGLDALENQNASAGRAFGALLEAKKFTTEEIVTYAVNESVEKFLPALNGDDVVKFVTELLSISKSRGRFSNELDLLFKIQRVPRTVPLTWEQVDRIISSIQLRNYNKAYCPDLFDPKIWMRAAPPDSLPKEPSLDMPKSFEKLTKTESELLAIARDLDFPLNEDEWKR
jgi:hypothetical protein